MTTRDPRSPIPAIDDPSTPSVEITNATVEIDTTASTLRLAGLLDDGNGPQSVDMTMPFTASDMAALEAAVGAGTAAYELVMGQPPQLRVRDAAGNVLAEVQTGGGNEGSQADDFKRAARIPPSCSPTVTEIPETGGHREVYGWTEPRQEPGQVDTLTFAIEFNSAGGVMSVAHLRTFPTS